MITKKHGNYKAIPISPVMHRAEHIPGIKKIYLSSYSTVEVR